MLMKEKIEMRSRAQVDPCKLEELGRLARRTEALAMEIACELHECMDGSGNPDPPKVGEETYLSGSGNPDPPKLDAIVDIAYGARTIREGVRSLS